nr:MAG TPA: hypothetical protein [Caudoviricetes sp.]
MLPTILQSYKLQAYECKDTKFQRVTQITSNIF